MLDVAIYVVIPFIDFAMIFSLQLQLNFALK